MQSYPSRELIHLKLIKASLHTDVVLTLSSTTLSTTSYINVQNANTGKDITTIPAIWTVSVNKGTCNQVKSTCITSFKNLLRRRLPAVPDLESRSFTISLLRFRDKSSTSRSMVDTKRPKLESISFYATTAAEAVHAQQVIKQWLNLPDPVIKPYWILVNPVSGKRSGMRVLNKTVLPILNLAGAQTEVHVSTRPQHATELAQSINENLYTGVLIIGGDGLFHEYMNGYLSPNPINTPKSRLALPIAHVGTGTGNGLAASLNMLAPEVAVLCALKQWTRPLDMAQYQTVPCNNDHLVPMKRGWMHLSATVGLIADIDIESEILRPLGSLRSDVWAVVKMMYMHTYGLQVAVVRDQDYATARAKYGADMLQTPRSDLCSGKAHGWTYLGPLRAVMANVHNVAHLSQEFNGCPTARCADGKLHLVLTRPLKRYKLLQSMLNQSKGSFVTLPEVSVTPAVAVYIEPMHPTTKSFHDHYPSNHSVSRRYRAGLVKDDVQWSKCRAAGHMVVDGEVVPYTGLLIQVYPGLVTTYAPIDLNEELLSRYIDPAQIQSLTDG